MYVRTVEGVVNLHILRDCNFSKQIWSQLNFTWAVNDADLNFDEWIKWCFVNSTEVLKR